MTQVSYAFRIRNPPCFNIPLDSESGWELLKTMLDLSWFQSGLQKEICQLSAHHKIAGDSGVNAGAGSFFGLHLFGWLDGCLYFLDEACSI